MECSPEFVRFFTETLRRNNLRPSEIHKYLVNAWGDNSPSFRSVCRYYQDFSASRRTTFDDRKRSGRPKTAITNEYIESIREAVDNDYHITIEQLVEKTGISHGSVHSIMTVELKKKYLCSTWVAHELAEEHKTRRLQKAEEWLLYFENEGDAISQQIVVIDEKWFYFRSIGTKASNKCWIADSANKPIVVRRQKQDKKCLAIVAVSFSGKVCFEVLPPFKTIDTDIFISFLKRMNRNFKRQSTPLNWENMTLIFDNVRPHISTATHDFLERKRVHVLNQPAYSPDFNLCDRYLFLELEKQRKRINFETREELSEYLGNALKCFHSEILNRQFLYLKNDLQKIIQKHGEYV